MFSVGVELVRPVLGVSSVVLDTVVNIDAVVDWSVLADTMLSFGSDSLAVEASDSPA